MKGSTLALCAVILATIATMRTDAVEQLTMDVSPMRSFAPSTLNVRVKVPALPDNRQLEIVADSAAFYRSSFVQLEGANGPSVVSIQFRRVPGGDYTVAAIVRDGSGRQVALAEREVSVFAPGEGQ
jgi:hypothetical protein